MLNFDSYAAGRTMADIGLDKDAREKGPRPCQPTRSFLVAMICLRPTADSPLVGVGVICFFLKRMFLLRPPPIPARHWLPVLFGRIWLRLFPGNPQK
jgi:hypothetical protein